MHKQKVTKLGSYGGLQLSRQNQKPHGKNKIRHGKTKNLTAKPNTSQQKQNSFGFAVGICFCREVFGFCCEVFGFAVRYFVFAVRFLVLPWGILFLPWGFWLWATVLASLITQQNIKLGVPSGKCQRGEFDHLLWAFKDFFPLKVLEINHFKFNHFCAWYYLSIKGVPFRKIPIRFDA